MFTPIVLNARNPGPMTSAGNNTYLLVGSAGVATLVDAGIGHPDHLAELDAALGRNKSQLESVLVTHGHSDHASGARAIRDAHGAVALTKYPWPEEDGRYLVRWRALRDGDELAVGDDSLTVVHTPGHSPDHVVFWHESSGAVFTGDLVVPGGSVMIPVSRGGNLTSYLASLERVLALAPRQLFPAHGPRVDDPGAVLLAHLEHRRMREQQVISALEEGRQTVETIAESIYDGLEPRLAAAARENVRAHLEKLKADGIAANEDDQWAL